MRITTRCLACLLCALLALSPVALAEAPAEAMGAYFKLSDLQLDVDGVTADLSGLGMEIGAVMDEKLTMYATAEAGDATLSAVGTIGEEGISFAMDGLSNRYVLPLEALMQAAGVSESDLEELLAAYETGFFDMSASLDVEAYAEQLEAYFTGLGEQINALAEDAVIIQNIDFEMYDDTHSCTDVMITIPTDVLRDAVVDGYAIMMDMMEDMAGIMEEAGADVTMTQTSLEEIDAMFASEPYAEIDIFTTEDSEELLSYIFTLYDSPEDETPIYFYLDLYMPEDGFAAYAFTDGGTETDLLEMHFSAYDDASGDVQLSMTENGEQTLYFGYDTGWDESGEFIIHNVSAYADDAAIDFHYNTDNATSRYAILQVEEAGETVAIELSTAFTGDESAHSEAGTLTLSAPDGTLTATVEYGVRTELPAIAQADLETVSIDTMDEASLAALSMEVTSATSAFMAEAIENLPWLADIINNMAADAPLTASTETVEVEALPTPQATSETANENAGA